MTATLTEPCEPVQGLVSPYSLDLTINDAGDIGDRLRPLLSQLEAELGYAGATSSHGLDDLLQGMHEHADHIGVAYPEGSVSWKAFRVGLMYAHLCYPAHPLEVRIYTGIYTWLAVYVDDEANKDSEEWQNFVPRFYSQEEQHNTLARGWDYHLRLCHRYFSQKAANFIITASLSFTNVNALAGCEVPRMARTAGFDGSTWAKFMRIKDGVGEVYGWFTFPKALYPDMSQFMEAVPDIESYVDIVNDILSFYKEEKDGEKHNYIHNRAFYEGTDVYTALEAAIKEAVGIQRRVQSILRGKESHMRAWNDHCMGFVSFHKSLDRYRLSELGLGEKYTDQFGNLTSLRQDI